MCIDLVGIQYIRKIHYFGRAIKDARYALVNVGGRMVHIPDLMRYASVLHQVRNFCLFFSLRLFSLYDELTLSFVMYHVRDQFKEMYGFADRGAESEDVGEHDLMRRSLIFGNIPSGRRRSPF